MLRLLERIIMEKTPHTITTLNNPLELADLLQRETFDLIITDLRMPAMDGLDILHYIHEHQRGEAVIIMTAFGSLDSALEALQQGVFDYITKPFKKEQIIFAVDRALRWQNSRRAAARRTAVFDVEPYDAAKQCFDVEYIRALAEKCHDDVSVVAARSGMDVADVESILKRIESSADEKEGR
jgi:YesN/AraC family two-component response regulator